MSFVADHRNILCQKKALICDNGIVIIPNINRPYIDMLLSKYSYHLLT